MFELRDTMGRRLRSGAASMTVAVVLCLTASIVEADDDEPSARTRQGASIAHVDFAEIHARIAYPADWHVAFSKGKLMGSLVITEPWSAGPGSSPARFTINAVSNLMRVRFRRVSEQVEEFARSLSAASSPRLLDSGPVRQDGYIGRGLELRSETLAGAIRRERRLYLAHDARDWLIIVSFTADESQWERLAPARAALLDALVLH